MIVNYLHDSIPQLKLEEVYAQVYYSPTTEGESVGFGRQSSGFYGASTGFQKGKFRISGALLYR